MKTSKSFIKTSRLFKLITRFVMKTSFKSLRIKKFIIKTSRIIKLTSRFKKIITTNIKIQSRLFI